MLLDIVIEKEDKFKNLSFKPMKVERRIVLS